MLNLNWLTAERTLRTGDLPALKLSYEAVIVQNVKFATLKLHDVDKSLMPNLKDLRPEVLETNRAINRPHMLVGLGIFFEHIERLDDFENLRCLVFCLGRTRVNPFVLFAQQLVLTRIRPAASFKAFVNKSGESKKEEANTEAKDKPVEEVEYYESCHVQQPRRLLAWSFARFNAVITLIHW